MGLNRKPKLGTAEGLPSQQQERRLSFRDKSRLLQLVWCLLTLGHFLATPLVVQHVKPLTRQEIIRPVGNLYDFA